MDLTFDCPCGETVSSYTRGSGDVEFKYKCQGCDTVYAITITPLEGPKA